MSWTSVDIPDQTGRVAVVTGGNGGLGLETAKALAGAGARVVIAARDRFKASSALTKIETSIPAAIVEVVELDLASLASVETAADTIRQRHPKVDILINNAGVMATPEGRTEDGFEMQLGVNHLGHWALTARLLPAVSQGGRIVTVTSFARFSAPTLDPANPHMEGTYEPWAAYNRSKRANFHFAVGLQKELERRSMPITSIPAHPGLSHTDLQVRTAAGGAVARSGEFWQWTAANYGMPVAKGALSQLWAATEPDARGGVMYGPRFLTFGAPVRRRIIRNVDEQIADLWKVSELETGIGLFDYVD